VRSILTIHNLPYMGAGTEAAFDAFGLPPSRYPRLPGWARKIPLPLGLQTAERIVAVSPTYAREILTPEYGCGLENFLQARHRSISGIVNGLDMESWDPEKDEAIPVNFEISSLAKRMQNKIALLKEFSLDPDPKVPLLILISRMDEQRASTWPLQGLSLRSSTSGRQCCWVPVIQN
jgi:starch synthase